MRHYGLYAVSAKVTTGLYMVNITVSGVHKLSKVEKPLQIPGARKVTCSKFCTDDPQILGATVQNLVVTAILATGIFAPPNYGLPPFC